METILKSTQEQATAAWIDHLNQIRLNELMARLNEQDINLEDALSELDKLKQFIGDPEHILGSAKTKHGEIAENVQVYISNARKLVEGLKAEYTFNGVGRTAPEDYLHNGSPIQSKFYVGPSGSNTFQAIKNHLAKYPDFIKNGGKYEIPKDQYEKIIELLGKPSSQLSRSEASLVQSIREWEQVNEILFTQKVHPSIVNYADVQQGKINETIHSEENSLKKTNRERRDNAYQDSKPTVKEGTNAAAASAVLEGGMAFCITFAKKRKEGKHLSEFTSKDWSDLGLETGIGTLKGGIRGASVYTLSNFTATPAAVASSLVTAVYGVTSQANALRKNEITKEDFIINSETICLEVSISAISSILGQVYIPVPILGPIIGNTIGMFIYEIVKDYGLTKEQELISGYRAEIEALNSKLDKQYHEFILQLEEIFRKYKSLMDFAFDPDVNVSFTSSVEFAKFNGVEESKILKNKSDIDAFFLAR